MTDREMLNDTREVLFREMEEVMFRVAAQLVIMEENDADRDAFIDRITEIGTETLSKWRNKSVDEIMTEVNKRMLKNVLTEIKEDPNLVEVLNEMFGGM